MSGRKLLDPTTCIMSPSTLVILESIEKDVILNRHTQTQVQIISSYPARQKALVFAS